MTEEAVWHIVKDFAKSLGVAKSAASRSAPDLCSALPRFPGAGRNRSNAFWATYRFK